MSLKCRVGVLLWIIYIVMDHFDFASQSFNSHSYCWDIHYLPLFLLQTRSIWNWSDFWLPNYPRFHFKSCYLKENSLKPPFWIFLRKWENSAKIKLFYSAMPLWNQMKLTHCTEKGLISTSKNKLKHFYIYYLDIFSDPWLCEKAVFDKFPHQKCSPNKSTKTR